MKIAHALKGMRLLQNSLYSISRDVPERDNNRNIFNFNNEKASNHLLAYYLLNDAVQFFRRSAVTWRPVIQ